MNIYLEAFGIFFKIGAFTIGGGYAMVPLIENEIVPNAVIILPRIPRSLYPIKIEILTAKIPGADWEIASRSIKSSCAIHFRLVTILPSFIIILAIALFFHSFKDNPIVERIFKGIRPAVVALIAAPTFTMGRSAKINRYNLWIPVVSAILIWLLGFSPIWIIIAAGVGGFLWGKFRKVES